MIDYLHLSCFFIRTFPKRPVLLVVLSFFDTISKMSQLLRILQDFRILINYIVHHVSKRYRRLLMCREKIIIFIVVNTLMLLYISIDCRELRLIVLLIRALVNGCYILNDFSFNLNAVLVGCGFLRIIVLEHLIIVYLV